MTDEGPSTTSEHGWYDVRSEETTCIWNTGGNKATLSPILVTSVEEYPAGGVTSPRYGIVR